VTAVLFYAGWPLGYHNPEAEHKAVALADAGFDVTYVAGIGIRNPRLSSAAKAVDRLRRGLARAEPQPQREHPRLRDGSMLVVPPRQLAGVRALNRRWVARQVRAQIGDWRRSVAWVRWPTPELVDLLATDRPAGIVYEAVDAYDATPGITGRWVGRFHAAERRLAALADVVVVPSRHLAERFHAYGARVETIPHGVDLDAFAFAEPRPAPRDGVVVGFVGTLDYRLDMAVLDHLATRRRDWRIRLIGPVQEGFDPATAQRHPNVSVEGPIPYETVGATIAGFDAGVMPYFDHPHYHAMTPLKNLEFLAVGRPAVARTTAALEPYGDVIGLADDPVAFTATLERMVSGDDATRARRRRAVAEAQSWDVRLGQVVRLASELSSGG
jgi:glycosyltransferase involved in cell wall biosynthesis